MENFTLDMSEALVESTKIKSVLTITTKCTSNFDDCVYGASFYIKNYKFIKTEKIYYYENQVKLFLNFSIKDDPNILIYIIKQFPSIKIECFWLNEDNYDEYICYWLYDNSREEKWSWSIEKYDILNNLPIELLDTIDRILLEISCKYNKFNKEVFYKWYRWKVNSQLKSDINNLEINSLQI